MVRILCPLLCPDTSCGSCTMMTVSYIEGIHLAGELPGDGIDDRIVSDYPEIVSETVLVHERVLRFAC